MARPSLCYLLMLALANAAGAATPELAKSGSAFLRESAGSPVAWQQWDPAVLRRAQEQAKPVYVFTGSFLSELSRATCRQTFTYADTAAFLNKNFICVIVDRDAQPEVAALLQHYLRNAKQVSTWPAHVWLTPELRPFEGAGYLPPTEEWGKPSFIKVAQQALNTWNTDPAGCRTRAAEAIASLASATNPAPAGGVTAEKLKEQLTAAAEAWRGQLDAAHGGFGDPPRYPEPELLRFLLRRSPADRAAALTTLRALAGSALRDPLDGGFFRYAADAAWQLPDQQKTLSDQARLALAFLDAAEGDDAAAFTAAARGALDYALNGLARADGTFAAAEDATPDECAGYYPWTQTEIDSVLGKDAAAFDRAHGVLPDGNISADDDLGGRLKGKNILRSTATDDAGLAASAARLLAVRQHRPAPLRDDRAPAGAHGLLLAALARAGTQPGGARYLAAAGRTFDVVEKLLVLSPEGDLRRFAGSNTPAVPADYTALALGCREYARAAHRPEAEALATKLLARAGQLFLAATGRYFATPAELPVGFFARPPAGGDAPSAEALAILAGAPKEQAQAMAAALSAGGEDASAPLPGDALLALSLFPSN